MKMLYSIGLYSYVLAIRLASPFNSKAKKWLKGRRDWQEKLVENLGKKDNVYWFHCASLGEFEQGKPVMEALKEKDSSITLLVTFFSPSGYELRKDYALADYVCYLPMDSAINAKKFISSLHITKAFFIKYEFWYHYFNELSKQHIPFYMVSAVFRPKQVFFKWYGKWYREILKLPTTIFVQDKASQVLLSKYSLKSVVSGDTRYDTVYENSLNAKSINQIEEFKGDGFLVVAGSSWQPEEKILADAFDGSYKLVIAPHDVSESHVKGIEKLFSGAVRYSNYKENSKVLIIDHIGMLSNLYQYADLAFVGGGFSGALHNILEPATFGVPVAFGPEHNKFHEANDMLQNGVAFEIKDASDFKLLIQRTLVDGNSIGEMKQANKAFIENRRGAKKVIIDKI